MDKLNKILGFTPNNDQKDAIEKITKFLSVDCEDDVYILVLYITGKFIVKSLVHVLYKKVIGKNPVQL